MTADSRGFVHPVREALLALGISTTLAALVRFVPQGDPGGVVKTIAPTLQVLAWMGPAYALAARRGVDPLVAHGLLVKPTGAALPLVVCFLLLPLYAVGWLWVTGGKRPYVEGVTAFKVAMTFLWHACFVALPEEYLFRGVVQPALARRGEVEQPWQAVALTSALFALAHVIFDRDPSRANVFFPGLVFGALRLRTGSIVPGLVFHAACNALDDALRTAYPTGPM